MSVIRVKLVRGLAGCPEKHCVIVRGLGLRKRDSTRLLPDTPQTAGMLAKVSYLVHFERVEGEPPKGRKARKLAAARP
jgi:large subunit ribosomal protein L30